MSIANAMQYEDVPVRSTKKKDLMVISEMRTAKIVWFLAYRHRVGLLTLSNLAFISYFAWDKILHVFFG